MNGRPDGGLCEWLVGKLQGPQSKHEPNGGGSVKVSKNGGNGGRFRHVWEVSSLKLQNPAGNGGTLSRGALWREGVQISGQAVRRRWGV